jgi:uroporphyrin-3 C-methyltransferase
MTTEQEDKQPDVAIPSSLVPPRRVSFLIKLIVVIAVGCAALSIYMVLQWRQESQSELQALRAKMLVMKTQQEHTSTQLESTVQSMHAVDEQRRLLDKQMNTVLQNQTYRTNDWILLKARYYLELAQINATWGSDTQTTSDLLNQADMLLTDVHEQRLLEVRRAIAQENTAVKAVEKIDVAGLLSQLDAAQELTHSLMAQSMPGQVASTVPATVDVKEASIGWRGRLYESVHALEKLFVVRRVDADTQPFITPVYAGLLRERIQLALQETQLAVLQGNEALYQLTLKQAIKQIKPSFDLQDPNTIALLKQLDDLQQRTIVQKKINIGQALLLLNQAIDVKQDKKPAADSAIPESTETGGPLS